MLKLAGFKKAIMKSISQDSLSEETTLDLEASLNDVRHYDT